MRTVKPVLEGTKQIQRYVQGEGMEEREPRLERFLRADSDSAVTVARRLAKGKSRGT